MDVTIAQGTFRGTEAHGCLAFKGIPYAAAPVGANRFAPPQPPTRHEGVADATEYGPTVSTPPQRSAAIDALLPDPKRPGENGLNLNIWTPGLDGAAPVFLFIHGGGFATGAGSTTAFDGTSFAQNGVLAITINYRLAVEGFLAIPGTIPNRGLLDMVAALEWVRDNIAAFGGDPTRVTIAGESAGAMAVLTLMAMPRARGLFHRAVSQSGDGHHVHTPDLAAVVSNELAAELGIDETLAAFDEVPVERLHEATNAVITRLSGTNPDFRRLVLQPVIDGEILPKHPIEAMRSGESAEIDLLIGTNADEYGLFVATTGLYDSMTDDMLLATTARIVDNAPELIEEYRRHLPDANAAELFIAIQSDWFCVVPTIRYIDARLEAGAQSHAYEFAWKPKTFEGKLGSAHILEVPFVFNTLHDSWGIELRGTDAPQELADRMHQIWVTFTKDGDPGWAAYGPNRFVQRIDESGTELVTDPNGWRRLLWSNLITP